MVSYANDRKSVYLELSTWVIATPLTNIPTAQFINEMTNSSLVLLYLVPKPSKPQWSFGFLSNKFQSQ